MGIMPGRQERQDLCDTYAMWGLEIIEPATWAERDAFAALHIVPHRRSRLVMSIDGAPELRCYLLAHLHRLLSTDPADPVIRGWWDQARWPVDGDESAMIFWLNGDRQNWCPPGRGFDEMSYWIPDGSFECGALLANGRRCRRKVWAWKGKAFCHQHPYMPVSR